MNIRYTLVFTLFMLTISSLSSMIISDKNIYNILFYFVAFFLYSSIILITFITISEFKVKTSSDTFIDLDSNKTLGATKSSVTTSNSNFNFNLKFSDFRIILSGLVISLVLLALLTLEGRPHTAILDNTIKFISTNKMGFFLLSFMLLISFFTNFYEIIKLSENETNRFKVLKIVVLASTIFGLLSSMYVSIFVLSLLLINYPLGNFDRLLKQRNKRIFFMISFLGLLVKISAIGLLNYSSVHSDQELVSILTFFTFIFSVTSSFILIVLNYVEDLVSGDNNLINDDVGLMTINDEKCILLKPKVTKNND